MSVRPSVRRSVRPSVRPSDGPSPVIFEGEKYVLGASCAVYLALSLSIFVIFSLFFFLFLFLFLSLLLSLSLSNPFFLLFNNRLSSHPQQHQMWNNLDNLEEMVNQYEDIPWAKSNGTHSTSSHSNKTWSAASSSSLHITRLFDEKSAADIESLYLGRYW